VVASQVGNRHADAEGPFGKQEELYQSKAVNPGFGQGRVLIKFDPFGDEVGAGEMAELFGDLLRVLLRGHRWVQRVGVVWLVSVTAAVRVKANTLGSPERLAWAVIKRKSLSVLVIDRIIAWVPTPSSWKRQAGFPREDSDISGAWSKKVSSTDILYHKRTTSIHFHP
jgi:hypothetical protein